MAKETYKIVAVRSSTIYLSIYLSIYLFIDLFITFLESWSLVYSDIEFFEKWFYGLSLNLWLLAQTTFTHTYNLPGTLLKTIQMGNHLILLIPSNNSTLN